MIDKWNASDAKNDLPVSEEMIGAYLEGNLAQEEASFVEKAIEENPALNRFVNGLIDDELEAHDWEDEVLEVDYDDFEIPFVENTFYAMNENVDLDNDHEFEEQLYLSANIMSEHTGKDAAIRIFGDAAEGNKNQLVEAIWQGTDSTCAIRCQEIVLRDYGIFVPEQKLAEFAEQQGWYSPEEGTDPAAMGKLLEVCGVDCNVTKGNTIYDLVNELSQGHRVIVGVDSGELWAQTFGEKSKEWFDDLIHGDSQADHALIVAGVEVNPDNPEDVKVVVTDTGAGHLRVEYPLDEFMDAWKDSDCQMVATTQPAPYQYNSHTEMMEPSNFVTEFELNRFVQDNSIALPPEAYNMPYGYEPRYAEGHLDNVGNVDYREFKHAYAAMADVAGEEENKSEFQKAWEALRDLFSNEEQKDEDLKTPDVKNGMQDNASDLDIDEETVDEKDSHFNDNDDDDDDDDDDDSEL